MENVTFNIADLLALNVEYGLREQRQIDGTVDMTKFYQEGTQFNIRLISKPTYGILYTDTVAKLNALLRLCSRMERVQLTVLDGQGRLDIEGSIKGISVQEERGTVLKYSVQWPEHLPACPTDEITFIARIDIVGLMRVTAPGAAQ